MRFQISKENTEEKCKTWREKNMKYQVKEGGQNLKMYRDGFRAGVWAERKRIERKRILELIDANTYHGSWIIHPEELKKQISGEKKKI